MSTYDSQYEMQSSVDLAQFHRLLAMDSPARLEALLDESYQYQALLGTDSSLLATLVQNPTHYSTADLTMYCQRIQLASAKFRSLMNVMVEVRSLHREYTRYHDDLYHQLWEVAVTEFRHCQVVIEGHAKIMLVLLAAEDKSSLESIYGTVGKSSEAILQAYRQLKEVIIQVENIRFASHDSSLG